MSNSAETTKTGGIPSAGDYLNRLRGYVSGRRGLIILAVAIVGAGIVLNWSWFVAIGVAPILLGLAPCAAMCAAGLCMNKMGGKSCSGEKAAVSADPRDPTGTSNKRS